MQKLLLATALAGGIAALSAIRPSAAAETVILAPPPMIDAPLAKAPGSETAVLSGGCFWGMQVVFQHVKGVQKAVSGYTGGAADTAHYGNVSTGTTGQAESLKITFDPSMISYGQLLRIYVSVATNPTELNYQGPDHGTQYRGEIWAENPQQRRIAQAYIRQLTADHAFAAPIVTRIDAARPFYPAEGYHQNFATLHPDNRYIELYDAPKVNALARLFPGLYVSHAAIVAVGSAG
ncbi:peptide-methionine (S)-S-oxide reductase MsrA [Acidiphilium rubrum]|uniref:Peptide methionine sulfoxide reductase MsrA n=2 Tax=Acidocellaceae TaxID=3385905 RepID=A0A8G2CNX8_ACIRU|nr:peptide-methionine (S)-S-oxide reductase MsrA [Acidiphilium rubrum]MCW8308736.1 peptide-methionine (S)-S-oxide reductase MsrA [Acidiphilium sp. PA]SIR52168.1 peptide-methionine (S)-S-oxide reductase [Acidiphilium rubrum]